MSTLPNHPHSTVLDTDEAARFLGISPASLASWRCTGTVRIPFVRIGRAIRYRMADLETFLTQHAHALPKTGGVA